MSFGSGGSEGGSGPIVCSSWTEGTNSDAPWLPSMEGTVGGRRRRGGANVCCDTIIHTLNVWRRGYWKGVGVKEMTGGVKEEGITNGQSAVCERRLTGSYEDWSIGDWGKKKWKVFVEKCGKTWVHLHYCEGRCMFYSIIMPTVKLQKRSQHWITEMTNTDR